MLTTTQCKFVRLDDQTMRITRYSMVSRTVNTRDLPITPPQWSRFSNGEMIQDALGHLSNGDREFILTGSTEADWEKLFGKEED